VSRIGLHLRLENSLVRVAAQAIALEMTTFQSFLMVPTHDGTLYVPSDREITQFRKLCEKRFTTLYAHAPFWLNLADPTRSSLDGLWRQVLLAQRLGFTHLIVHPGSSVQASKSDGIAMVARTLNALFRKKSSVTVLLENTAHGNRSVGSDIHDLSLIRALLDKPEKLQFCIDTAHAHAYGYAVNSAESMHNFLQSVHTKLGEGSIGLLHLNDTLEECGSYKDRHALLGAGTVGKDALQAALRYEQWSHIPVIVEPPVILEKELVALYRDTNSWY